VHAMSQFMVCDAAVRNALIHQSIAELLRTALLQC
jgi:hypothetical protein